MSTGERRRIGVVVNPDRTDGSDTVIDGLRALDCEVTTARPAAADGLQDAIAQLVDGGVDAIAAVGGDGTQRTVAAELLDGEVALAVIPGGTVNLLAQVLGVDDVDEAVRVAATGETRIVDVGLISCDGATDDVFVLNASSGWDAAVIEQVGDGAKRFGRLGFVAAGLAQWFRTEPTPVTIDVDGRRWYADPALTVLVMNVGQRGSASLDLAPDAEFDDGRLDVIVLRRHSTIGLVRAGWRIIRGRPASTADVVTAQGAEIVVAWGKAVATQRDGDERASTDRLRYRSVPGGLRVMVPSARS